MHIHENGDGQSRNFNVITYDPLLGHANNLNTVNTSVAYDFPDTGEIIILLSIKLFTVTPCLIIYCA